MALGAEGRSMRRISGITKMKYSKGFTLVEMLVVIPMVILLITGMIVAVVNLSGAAMRSSGKIQLQNEVLRALDQIEQDVRLSIDFEGMTTTQISLRNLATDGNPMSAERKLIRTSDCSSVSSGLTLADALSYKLDYTVEGGKRLRRVARLDRGCASSPIVWQKPIDERLISADEVVLNITGSGNAIEVTLTAKRSISGVMMEYTGTMYVKSLNF